MDRRRFLRIGGVGGAAAYLVGTSTRGVGAAGPEPPALARLEPGPLKQEVAKLIEAARGEGKVVIYAPSPFGETFARKFKAHFGLADSYPVEEAVYKTADLQGKVEIELKAGKLGVDFARFPVGPWVFGLQAKGLLMKWPNPEEKAYSTSYVEPGYWIPTFWAPVLVWNPQKIADTLESWQDLLNPKYLGKIAIGDASKSAGWAQIFYILTTKLSTKYLEDLARNKPAFIVSAESLLEAVVSGEYPIATTTSFTAFRGVTQRKVDLRVAYPKDGIAPNIDALLSFKDSPHPSSAKLVRMFHASKEGQQHLMGESGFLSFRPDIESPNEKLLPPVSKLNVISFDFRNLTRKDLDQFRKDFTRIFGI